MRNFLIPVLVLALSVSDAAAYNAPLAPGKPAGLHQAQMEGGNTIWLVAGLALVGIAVALATADNGSSPNNNTTMSTTSTTPAP